jgi:hypothetical protein
MIVAAALLMGTGPADAVTIAYSDLVQGSITGS